MVTKAAAGLAGTVEVFCMILTGRLTRYDKQLADRGDDNMHRLSLWFGALREAKEMVQGQMSLDTPEALNALKKALDRKFIVNSMPPVKAVIKMIDQFLASGKAPKYATADRVIDRFLGINTGT